MANHKKYFTEEERKLARREAGRKFRETHPGKHKEWALKNQERIKERMEKYKNTVEGRSVLLYNGYKNDDKHHNRGEGDITAEWIAEHILSQPCVHCGETDWTKIGCNRLDNTKPHTKDNVEPCCWKCNNKLGRVYTSEKNQKKVYMYDKDTMELIAVYNSASEAAEALGTSAGNVSSYCLQRKHYNFCKGYVLRYEYNK